MSKVFIIVNGLDFYQKRGALVKAMLDEGHQVTICSDSQQTELEALGCQVHVKSFVPSLAGRLSYYRMIKGEAPDIVLLFGKTLHGSAALAAHDAKVPYALFIDELPYCYDHGKKKPRRVKLAYKTIAKNARLVFFANKGMKEFFVTNHLVEQEQAVVTRGAGMDVASQVVYDYPEESEPIRFLFAGTVEKKKGIIQYLKCARVIKLRFPETQFDLVGPRGEADERADKLLDEVIGHGEVNDLGDIPFDEALSKCHCFIYPSWYEDMSETLMKVAAAGRPIITTRIPGCQEAVKNHKNGRTVKERNWNYLRDAMYRFYEKPYAEKKAMAAYSRKLALRRFDETKINRTIMARLFEE